MKSVIEFSAGKGLYRLEAVLPGVISASSISRKRAAMGNLQPMPKAFIQSAI